MAYDDQFAIGRPDIMKHYCNLVNMFGTFKTHNLRDNFKLNMISIENWKKCVNKHWHELN